MNTVKIQKTLKKLCTASIKTCCFVVLEGKKEEQEKERKKI